VFDAVSCRPQPARAVGALDGSVDGGGGRLGGEAGGGGGECERGGADEAGVGAELGRGDGDVGREGEDGVGGEVAPQRFGQDIAGLGDPAADDRCLDLDEGCGGGDPCGEGVGGPVEGAQG
jgi:hypothetical protein